MKLKHKLPICAILEHANLPGNELDNLKEIAANLDPEFRSVLEINRQLCGVHHILAQGVYDNFFQIALTDSASSSGTTVEECELIHKRLGEGSKSESYRKRLKAAADINNPLNERTYNLPTGTYMRYENLFNSILGRFKGKPTRVRLVKLKAGTNVDPHIDYDPSYSVRVIIPIISPEDCINLFWEKGEVKAFNLHEGKAYFLNTGYRHAVINMGKVDRYTLLVSVDTILDIEHLIT